MQVLIMRHGYAESAYAATDDSARSLTLDGKRIAEQAARGLKTLVPHLDAIITSPLKRALQTGQIIGEVYGFEPEIIQARPFLAGNYLESYFNEIGQQIGEVNLFIGHLPSVAQFVNQALPGGFRHDYTPTAVTLLEFSGRVQPKQAQLRGFYTAEELAHLVAH